MRGRGSCLPGTRLLPPTRHLPGSPVNPFSQQSQGDLEKRRSDHSAPWSPPSPCAAAWASCVPSGGLLAHAAPPASSTHCTWPSSQGHPPVLVLGRFSRLALLVSLCDWHLVVALSSAPGDPHLCLCPTAVSYPCRLRVRMCQYPRAPERLPRPAG